MTDFLSVNVLALAVLLAVIFACIWICRGGEPFDRFLTVLDRITSIWGGPRPGS